MRNPSPGQRGSSRASGSKRTLAPNDARRALDGESPQKLKKKGPAKMTPKKRLTEDTKGLIQSIKGSAFSVVDDYLAKFKPKDFGTSVQTIALLRNMLAENFGAESEPTLLRNRVDAAEHRYRQMWRSLEIYRHMFSMIAEHDEILNLFVKTSGGPPVSPALEGLLRNEKICYSSLGKTVVDAVDLMQILPTDRILESYNPNKNTFKAFTVAFCNEKFKK